MVDQALTRNPNDPFAPGARDWLLAIDGKYAEARANTLARVNGTNEMNRNFHHGAYHSACVFALTGDATSAVRFLDAAVKNGMPNYPAFSRDKCFDKVRGAPEFATFMARLKPVWEEYQRSIR